MKKFHVYLIVVSLLSSAVVSGILFFVKERPVGASGSTPTADAGPAKTLNFPAKDLTLFGHVSDPEDDPLVAHWRLVSGPAAVTFSNADALITTVSFTTTGIYTFQLSANDGTSNITSNVTATVNPASSQTAFYVDPTYTGSSENGSAANPWKSLLQSDSDYAAKWSIINSTLAANDVIIYFSARTAGSDASEQFLMPYRGRLFLNRGCRAGTFKCTSGADTTGTHRLTVDGMSKYNTNDAAPNWADYAGTNKFKIDCANICGSMSIGWDDDNQRDYITIRGFETTGPGSRIRWGGSYSVLENMWVHDVTLLGATVQFNAAVNDYPNCQEDFGRDHDITIRNNLIERGRGEGLYIAGTYNKIGYGGCPDYGNTHSDILIEGNTIRDPGIDGAEGDGIDLKMGLMNVTVRNNLIQDMHVPAGSGGDAVGITALGVFSPAKTNYLIEGNRIFNSVKSGMLLGGQNGTVIRNNLIYNVPSIGIYLAGDPAPFENSNVEIYNNTILGGVAGVGSGDSHNIKLRNNIIFGVTSIGGYNTTGVDSDYNILGPNSSNFSEGAHSFLLSDISSLFVNAAGGDFHLASASLPRDNGTDLVSTGFATDFDKLSRPRGASWDIGAYEFDSGPPPAPLTLCPFTPAPTPTPIPTATPPPGLIAYWKFDDRGGTTAADSSGNGRTGTLVNRPVRTAGKFGKALTFSSAANNRVTIADITPMNGAPQLTLAMWFQRTTSGAGINIYKSTVSMEQIAIQAYASQIYLFPAGSLTGYGQFASNDTAWHHIVMIFDGTATGNTNRLKVYFDGVAQTLSYQGTVPATTASNTANFFIGEDTDGAIDDVQIYNRMLTESEVQQIYSGVGALTPDKFTVGDLIKVSPNAVSVRSCADVTCSIVGAEPVNAFGAVIGGPMDTESYTWWQIHYENGTEGWTIEDSLDARMPGESNTCAASSPSPSGTSEVGTPVSNSLSSSPLPSSTVVGSPLVPTPTPLLMTASPTPSGTEITGTGTATSAVLSPITLRGTVETVAVNTRAIGIKSEGGTSWVSVTNAGQIFSVYAISTDLAVIKQKDLVEIRGILTGEGTIDATLIRVLDTASRFQITEFDTGRAFVFNADEQFTVILNKQAFPPDKLVCTTPGLLKKTEVQLSAGNPMSAQTFTPAKMGHCKLTNGTFRVEIQITNKDEM